MNIPSVRALLVLSLVGCTPAVSPMTDAAGDDAGASDSGAVDSGGPMDAGPTDAGRFACSPAAACTRVGGFLGEVYQRGDATPTLRNSHLTIAHPAALATGLVHSVLDTAFTPDATSCNLNGGATANWILEETDATHLAIGAARPVTAGNPYAFIDETIGSLPVAPVMATEGSSGFGPVDVILPVFLDAAGTQVLLFPVRDLVVTMTTDASNTCVGTYNAAGLDPANSCLPDATHPAFLDDGTLTGFIGLEDADAVDISTLSESLCVLLSGNATMYGDGASPVQHCKRTGGVIDFPGDWCSATNTAATSTCHDAVQLDAAFAASGVALAP
jgi:hypothetical protein